MKRSLAALAFVVNAAPAVSADAPQVPYPDGYRDWRHVKSMVIQPGHALHESFGGIHHLYANKKALEGYKTGKFPDGSVGKAPSSSTTQRYLLFSEDSRRPRCGSLHGSTLY